MSWGIVAVGATVAGAVISSQGQKKAAKIQSDSARDQAELSKQMYDQTRSDLSPFMQAGQFALPQLMQSMQPIDRTAALGDYYAGPEYAMMQQQAAQNQMAGSEAMGGMGATSTGNALAYIAPQMGMQHLGTLEAQRADQYNRAMGLAGLGQSAAAQVGSSGQGYSSQAGQAYQQAGAANAASALGQAKLWGQTLGSLGGLAYQGFNSPAAGGASSGGTTNIAGGGAWNNIPRGF